MDAFFRRLKEAPAPTETEPKPKMTDSELRELWATIGSFHKKPEPETEPRTIYFNPFRKQRWLAGYGPRAIKEAVKVFYERRCRSWCRRIGRSRQH